MTARDDWRVNGGRGEGGASAGWDEALASPPVLLTRTARVRCVPVAAHPGRAAEVTHARRHSVDKARRTSGGLHLQPTHPHPTLLSWLFHGGDVVGHTPHHTASRLIAGGRDMARCGRPQCVGPRRHCEHCLHASVCFQAKPFAVGGGSTWESVFCKGEFTELTVPAGSERGTVLRVSFRPLFRRGEVGENV